MRRPELAGPALDAARRALRDLEEDHVPAALRRVAASSDRRLPGPLAEALVRAVDSEAWLRELALEHFDEADPESANRSVAWSSLFLLRPDGWEERAEALESDTSTDALAHLRALNARLEARIRRLEVHLAEAREELRARPDSPDDAVVERLGESNRVLRRELAEVRGSLREANEEAAEMERQIEEADRRIAELKRRLALRERRREPPPGVSRAFGGGDPVTLARILDDLQRSLIQPMESVAEAAVRERPAMAPGTRPDAAEAVDWLIAVDQPTTVLIDGYNLAFHYSSAPDTAVRTKVQRFAARIRRLAEGAMTVVVFWDSQEAVDSRRADGVDVRFVPSADEAIVEEASRAVNPVVVSDDRDVLDRSSRAGAVAVWSRAAKAWIDQH